MFPGLVRFVETKLPNTEDRDVNEEAMINQICEIIGVTVNQFKGKTRKREVVTSRIMFSYFMKKFTTRSLAYIGSRMNRDHATIMNQLKTFNNLIETDKEFKSLFRKIESAVTPDVVYITKDDLEESEEGKVFMLAYNEIKPVKVLLKFQKYERGIIYCKSRIDTDQWRETIHMFRVSLDDFVYFDLNGEPMRLFYFNHYKENGFIQ